MENEKNPNISFANSYEVKKFDEICAELLILDKVFPSNLDSLDQDNSKSTINYEQEKNTIDDIAIDGDMSPNRPIKRENKILRAAKNEKYSQDTLLAIWHIFVQLIKQQKVDAESSLTQANIKLFNEVLFVSVALIDEYFIRKEKPIYDFWKKNLLEFHFFKTRSAGEVFYENIDEILQQNNTVKKNVAFIYLQALSMGFKGKYFHSGNQNDILYYKRSIYSFIFNKNLFVLDESGSPSLGNGAHIFLDLDRKALSNTRKIYSAIFMLIIIYSIVTFFIWYPKKSYIETLVKRIGAPMELMIK